MNKYFYINVGINSDVHLSLIILHEQFQINADLWAQTEILHRQPDFTLEATLIHTRTHTPPLTNIFLF